MNQQPLNILRDWINTQGIRVCEDPRRVEAYLKDFCGTDKREIFVLVQAMRQNVVADLRQGPTPPFTADVFKARLVQRLYDNLGLDEDIARWAVEGWRFVLGIEDVMPTGISPAAKAPKKPATRRKKASVPTQPATAATPPRIAKRYEISADGEEVIDHEIGLIWRRTAEPGVFTLEQALKHAEQQAEESGKNWRVPSIKELQTLVDTSQKNPTINTTVFPGTAVDFFHSSTRNDKLVYAVNFQDGSTSSSYPTDADAIRLVRTQPNDHYELSTDGQEVIDHETGLIWRRSVEPGRFRFEEVQAHVKSVSRQTGVAWRMPTIDELKTLIDEKRTKRGDSPVIDTDFFPERVGEWFWSSSPYADSTVSAWVVNFNFGGVGDGYRGDTYAVRLVRGG